MVERRDTYLDAARGLGILLVLCGHLLEPTFLENGVVNYGLASKIWRAIYTFHMPFFFLVSGMTDKFVECRRPVYAKTIGLKLVLTALVFSLIAYIPQVLAESISVRDVLWCHLAGSRLGLAPLWFLIALAFVRSIYAVASKMTGRVAYWSFLAVVLAASSACAKFQFQPWYLQSLLGAIPFYFLGRRSKNGRPRISMPAALCGLAAVLACSSTNFVHLAAGQYGDLPTFAAGALGGCCFALALVGYLRGVALAAAAYLGCRSFELFIVSGIVLTASPMMRQLDNAAGLSLILMLGVPLQIALARLLRCPIIATRRAVEVVVDLWHRAPIASAGA